MILLLLLFFVELFSIKEQKYTMIKLSHAFTNNVNN